MRIKVANAPEAMLNYLVHKALGKDEGLTPKVFDGRIILKDRDGWTWELPYYTTRWESSGKIMADNLIVPDYTFEGCVAFKRDPKTFDELYHAYGHTPLVAAMRCFILSKLWPEIEVPDNLEIDTLTKKKWMQLTEC